MDYYYYINTSISYHHVQRATAKAGSVHADIVASIAFTKSPNAFSNECAHSADCLHFWGNQQPAAARSD
jgi:hypothetical protein